MFGFFYLQKKKYINWSNKKLAKTSREVTPISQALIAKLIVIPFPVCIAFTR